MSFDTSQPQKAEKLASKIKVRFNNIDLLKEALTHRSYLNENRNYPLSHNERLEFLGDAVLELVVTEYLFKKYNRPEGEMTAWRAALVNGEMLAKVGKKLKLENFLKMSKGEAKDTGRARQYLLANAMEAIIGALYLDQGYEEAKRFIKNYIIVNLKEILEKKLYLDPKSYFQEKAQEITKITPHYELLEESGPDHDKHFVVGAYLDRKLIAKGIGISKQAAQRAAARAALEKKKWL